MIQVAAEPNAHDAKPTRRRAPRATRPQDAKRTKVSLYLSDRTAKLLSVSATMEDRSMSDLVEALITQNLKRWVVSDRSRSGESAGPAMLEGSAS